MQKHQNVIEVENLEKVYHARGRAPVHAVRGMSFNVRPGIIFGLLGPNGAGKSTMLKILTTLSRPTAGTARLLGYDVVKKPLEVRRRISSVIQETAVELFLSVRDNLLTFARFHGLPKDVALRRAQDVMERFQLTTETDRKVQDLSGGFRRRVQVAKVFMVETPIMFLDEFSTGMDPILKREVMAALRREAERGRTIVLTTQILSEAEELCDDILIMNRGREIARGDLNTLKLLSQGVYEVSLTFDHMPSTIREELAKLPTIRVNIEGNTLEMAVKSQERSVLDLITGLARERNVLRVEVNGASLEDIFVELTQKEQIVASD